MPIQRTNVPYSKEAIRLGRVVCDTKSKKGNKGNKGGDGFINGEPFINERKPSSTTVAKNYLKQW